MTVLVISQEQDLTADRVVLQLHGRVPVARIDLGDFPTALRMSATTGEDGWRGVISAGPRTIDLADITAVYYRRPSPFRMTGDMSGAEAEWAVREARHGFGGVLAAINCRWVNNPHHMAAATKPVQIAAAIGSGLAVPSTLITNDPRHARDFLGDAEGAVYKTLSGSPSTVLGHAIYTQALPRGATLTGVDQTAHLFQEFVPKQYEVRLTVVGERLFAARIDAGSEAARLDWRTDYASLKFTPIDVPDDVAAGVRALMAALRLRFGALDFVVDPSDVWWFLEINPNGQWGWVEDATGQPIADAIAADLQGDPA